jgi:iron complex outermembrane receptor protein
MLREKLAAIAAAVACLLSSAVRAQAAPEVPANTTLNEVVVTAQRREESLKDVPLSVTVATAAQLEQRNFNRPEELPYLVPSLQLTSFQDSPGATNFSIRGVGTASFSNLVEPSVATVIDGIVMSRPEMGVMEFSDIDRIEVLSGPQGMLFGKNASAGLVNIVTTRPELNQTEFQVDGDWGRAGAADDPSEYRGQVMANVPLSSTAALRVNAYFSNLDPLYKDLYGDTGDFGQKQAGGKVKFLVEPTDALSVYLSADYSESTGMGAGAFTQRSNGPASSFTPYDAAVGIVPSPNNVYLASNALTTLHFAVGGIQSEVAYKLNDDLTLTNILGYREYDSHYDNDFDLLPVNILDASDAAFHMSQITEEVRISSSSQGRFNYQAGLFYYNGVSDRTDFSSGDLGLGAPAAPFVDWLGLHARNNENTESYAAYGQGTLKLTDQLRLTGGLRVTHDDVKLNAYNYDTDADVINISTVAGPVSYDEEQKHTNVSGRVSAQYDLTPDTMTYVTIATGYKGPGFNLSWSGSPGAAPVGPETSVDYELGIKTTLARQLAFNASVYLEQFHNFQVQSYVPGPTPGTAAFIIQNAGQVRAVGVEAQAQWNVTHGLSFSAGLNYNDAVYTRFTGAPCYGGQTVVQGCINAAVDASGNQLANAPRWTGTLGGDYKHDLGHNLAGFLHVDAYAVSTVNFNADLDPNTVQTGYTLVNGSLGILGNGDTWKLSLYCRNCADRRFASFIQSNPAGGPGDYDQAFSVDSFRTIGVAARYRF